MTDEKLPIASYAPLQRTEPKSVFQQESRQERYVRQKRERYQEMQEAHAYCEANKEKFAQERANLTAEREAIGFKLGWMQAPVTQPLEELWGSLFTADTLDEQKKVHQAM